MKYFYSKLYITKTVVSTYFSGGETFMYYVLIKSVKVGRETKNLTTALGRRTSGHIWHVVKHSLLPLLDSPRSDPMQREFRP